MALLIYYQRIRNDPNEMEYQLGETRENPDRVLAIDKTSNTVRTDQPEDMMFRSAAGEIRLWTKREKAWPRTGVIASSPTGRRNLPALTARPRAHVRAWICRR